MLLPKTNNIYLVCSICGNELQASMAGTHVMGYETIYIEPCSCQKKETRTRGKKAEKAEDTESEGLEEQKA